MQPALVLTEAQQVDRFWRLDQQVKAFAPTAKEHTELASLIRTRFENLPAEQDAIAEGVEAQVLISARSVERTLGFIAKVKVFKLIGKAAFLAMVNLTLKAATSVTDEETVDKLATSERTGYRKLVAIAKLSKAA